MPVPLHINFFSANYNFKIIILLCVTSCSLAGGN